MKIGQKVAVCQDGKWGRRVEGVVIKTHYGKKIKVRFTYGYDEETTHTVECWFKIRPTIRYVRNNGNTFTLKRYKNYAGWVDSADWWCPWFTVYKWKDED